MLLGGIDRLSLERHDFGGSASALLAGFIRRIDRLKAHLIGAEEYARWAARLAESGSDADAGDAGVEQEFAEVYRVHEQLLAEAGARDTGDLIRDALRVVRSRASAGRRFEHVLVDDAHDLDLASATLASAAAGSRLTVAADPVRYAGDSPLPSSGLGDARVISARAQPAGPAPDHAGGRRRWSGSTRASRHRPKGRSPSGAASTSGPRPRRWRPTSSDWSPRSGCRRVRSRCWCRAWRGRARRSRSRSRSGRCPTAWSGKPRSSGGPRSGTCWRGYGCWPIPRTRLRWCERLARPPVELRSVDIARCTQIARRRKLDMVGALEAAIEATQVPPEARERIHVFLKLYRAGMAEIDSTRPDMYLHRLIDRLGLRRQQLFAAQSNVVERLRALARFGELAAAFARRLPHATPREFARHIAAVADFGLREHEEPDLRRAFRGSGRGARRGQRARGRARVRAGAARGAVGAGARPGCGFRRRGVGFGGCGGRPSRRAGLGGRARLCISRSPGRGAASCWRIRPSGSAGRHSCRRRPWRPCGPRRAAPGRTRRRRCSGRPRRCTRPTGCSATRCSREPCGRAGGSPSSGWTRTWTCPTRWCDTWSC